MNSQQALLELTLLNAEAQEESFEKFFIAGTKMGIPPEVLTRLHTLWEQVQVVAGHAVAIGKIIVQRIFAFLSANPRIAIGVAIGLALTYLLTGVPFIGPFLAPLATVLAVTGAGYGAVSAKNVTPSVLAALTALVEKFFELLRGVFEGVAQYVETAQ